jgi:hypothetical protein
VTVVIWRTIAPPHGTTFTECRLGCMNPPPSCSCGLWVALCIPHCPSGRQQLADELLALCWIQMRIAQSPEPATNHKVPAIWRLGVLFNGGHETASVLRNTHLLAGIGRLGASMFSNLSRHRKTPNHSSDKLDRS